MGRPRGATFGQRHGGVVRVDSVEDALVADLRLGDEADLAAQVRGARRAAHGDGRPAGPGPLASARSPRRPLRLRAPTPPPEGPARGPAPEWRRAAGVSEGSAGEEGPQQPHPGPRAATPRPARSPPIGALRWPPFKYGRAARLGAGPRPRLRSEPRPPDWLPPPPPARLRLQLMSAPGGPRAGWGHETQRAGLGEGWESGVAERACAGWAGGVGAPGAGRSARALGGDGALGPARRACRLRPGPRRLSVRTAVLASVFSPRTRAHTLLPSLGQKGPAELRPNSSPSPSTCGPARGVSLS